jgi:hypothetical protein
METYSFITLEFTEDLTASEVVSFDYTDGVNTITVSETWSAVRYTTGLVSITTPTIDDGEASAINFVNAFNSDYNTAGLFVVERTGNIVTIGCTVYGIDFENLDVPASVSSGGGVGTAPFGISSITFSTSGDCDTIIVSILTSQIADEILSPIQQLPVANPIVFEYGRELSFTAHVRKGTDHKSQIVSTPAGLHSSGIILNINDNPAGSSVTILAGGNLLVLTYSLDGSTYQSSNVFSNLVGGVYTAYVKDQFGCVATKDFELDGFGINSPFFNVPESNSIRFANRVTFGDCGNYKNDFNTLSCEADVPLPRQEILQFQSCDVITTQFKSNYSGNGVEVNNAEFPVIKKTDFMRRKDRRDAKISNLGDGSTRTAVFFRSGNLYDYDTNAIIGDYTLNGSLPEWGKAGNFLKHPNGNWYLIEDVLYLESKSADVLVIDTGTAPLIEVDAVVSCFYNFKNYEVYEFTIDFANYIDEQLQVKILATDTYFDEVEFLSEIIDVKVRHPQTLEIKYSSDENGDLYYATGITNTIRIPLEYKDASHQSVYDSYDTDNDSILISSDLRKLKAFVFSPMTEQMMDKVLIAVSHKFVTMDRVPYKIESSETELLGETNTYDVKVTMKLKSSLYSGDGLQFDETGMEIPALIPTGTGYVKYQ